MTFCGGAYCSIKTTCKRYKEIVNFGETNLYYFTHIPYDKEKKECEMLIPVIPVEEIK